MTTTPALSTPPRPKRRWLQFRLRTLPLLVFGVQAAHCVAGEPETHAYAELYSAIGGGNLARVSEMVREHPESVNAVLKRRGGLTPLHWAVADDRVEMAALLLRSGADVNATDSEGATPLHLACRWSARGDAKMATLLIESGADVNAVERARGWTPLIEAVFGRHQDVVRLLLETDADVNAEGMDGNTALSWAVDTNHLDVTCLLLEAGAHHEAKGTQMTSILHDAIYQDHRAIAQALVDHGFSRDLISAVYLRDRRFVEQRLDENPTAIDTGLEWRSLLWIAARSGDLEMIELLVKRGASLDGKSSARHPLTAAVDSRRDRAVELLLQKGASPSGQLNLAVLRGNLASVRSLLRHGADPNEKKATAWAGLRPLHHAVDNANAPAARMLIAAGADVNARDAEGYTPLQYAALANEQFGKTYDELADTIMVLLSNGAEVDLVSAAALGLSDDVEMLLDKDPALVAMQSMPRESFSRSMSGRTVLHWAVERDRLKIAKLLIARGAKVNARDEEGVTPLHLATTPDVIDVLTRGGANVNAKDQRGETALHRTAGPDRSNDRRADECARRLIAHGADVDARDSEAWTPLHFAASYPNENFVRALLTGGASAAADSEGARALHRPAADRSFQVVSVLLEAGAEVDARNDEGNTPLHLASRTPSSAVAEVLLGHGAEVDARNNDGNTPLHLASHAPSSAVAEALLGHGADVTLTNERGRTPFAEAVQQLSAATVVEVFRARGIKR